MKIIHVTGAPCAGGAEVYIKDLASSMVALGHDVCVVFISHNRDLGLSTDFEDRYLKDLSNNGVEFKFLEVRNRKNFIKGSLSLKVAVDDFDADVVHCHLYYAALYTLFLNCKIVYTHHNIKLGIHPLFYKLFLNSRIDRYIGICESCNELIQNVSGRDCVKIYNGVSSGRLIAKNSYVTKNDFVQIIAVGRFNRQKGYETMFQVVEKLKSLTSAPFKLSIVGEGDPEYASELKELANKEGLVEQGMIEFLGCRTDVPELLSNSDIFIMTSRWEGLPIAQIEAVLTGLPMVVTDVGGCREIVESCDCGFVISPSNVSEFANALRNLIENHTLRTKFAQSAREKSYIFDVGVAAKEHVKVYKNL
ncbi:glycogen synthase [Rubritalea halochordaticola]|uniref:Glycogen synthase n=1 Tax=Rubritalea halochordaticola TaxID=714537 RepID=A0ABP9UZQ3_9BACT